MGVRVIVDDDEEECDNVYPDYSTVGSNNSSGTCYVCGAQPADKKTTDKSNSSSSSSSNSHDSASSKLHRRKQGAPQAQTTFHRHSSTTEMLGSHNFSCASKELVGNGKEFRIEHNKYDLRIIGNGNRVRIGENAGNLQIIGNSTRLKISCNSGHIRYTGNDGRICLGSDSKQQAVDYIGCNGLLKIINATEQCTLRCKNKNTPKPGCEEQRSTAKRESDRRATGNADVYATAKAKDAANILRNTTIPKSASFDGHMGDGGGGGAKDDGSKGWTHFEQQFKRQSDKWRKMCNISLPDLKKSCGGACKTDCKADKVHCNININNPVHIVRNFGNIVIQNSVNVSI